MKLKSIRYSQYSKDPREWSIDKLPLGQINLLVGKNATGKSKTLNIIRALAELLSGGSKITFDSGRFETLFEHDGESFEYFLEYQNDKVVEERLLRNGEQLMKRGPGGSGTIRAEKVGDIEFQAPEDEVAAFTRRDAIQHSFFDPLYQWASSLRHYRFNTSLGKQNYAVFNKDFGASVNTKDPNQVVGLYRKGENDFGTPFQDAILADMRDVGYDLDDIKVGSPISFRAVDPLPGELLCLIVQEKGLTCPTDQQDMSDGMFRALSVIIHLNFVIFGRSVGCVLIDDIGEGLDFDRSCRLIDVIMHKVASSGAQLIMTSNDRFVMNKVPIECWSVFDRKGGHIQVFNYENSKAIFDDFKYTGLSNFDFFASNFIHEEVIEDETTGDIR